MPNPTSDNVADYRLDTNVVAAGRWSYESIDGSTVGMLKKGGSGVFASDEWAADTRKPEHAWFVPADGSIGPAGRPRAVTYPVAAAADGPGGRG
ncbi:MAG: hypothetical protein ACTHJI_15780, partial [Leifsonia sp.]